VKRVNFYILYELKLVMVRKMTLCMVIQCTDGILIASDSRTVYGRGVPISRDTNKIHIIEHKGLVGGKIAVVGAGTVAFIDKFIRMFRGTDFEEIARDAGLDKLNLYYAMNKIAEPIASTLYKEYVEGRKVVKEEETFQAIIAGFEQEGIPDAFILYSFGLAEPVDDFGAIGSGAAYAELFLRYLLPSERKIESVIKPACYTIRLVGTIDPFVGGKMNLVSISQQGVKDVSDQAVELPEKISHEALKCSMNALKDFLSREG